MCHESASGRRAFPTQGGIVKTAARTLAVRYDQYVSALWRGDYLPEPDACPDALSACGGAGTGIRWYETPVGVLGYVSGRRGCYQIIRADEVPSG